LVQREDGKAVDDEEQPGERPEGRGDVVRVRRPEGRGDGGSVDRPEAGEGAHRLGDLEGVLVEAGECALDGRPRGGARGERREVGWWRDREVGPLAQEGDDLLVGPPGERGDDVGQPGRPRAHGPAGAAPSSSDAVGSAGGAGGRSGWPRACHTCAVGTIARGPEGLITSALARLARTSWRTAAAGSRRAPKDWL